MGKKVEIISELTNRFNALTAKNYEVIGVFLYGSQNYNIDIESSDIDSIAIVLPSINDIASNEPPARFKMEFDNGEMDVKDIRLFNDSLLKQGLPFIETLFTEYAVLNPIYASLFQSYLSNAETIAHANEHRLISNIYWQIESRYKKAFSTEEIDIKSICHMIALNDMINKYLSGFTYKECLRCSEATFIRGIRTNPDTFTPDTAHQFATHLMTKVTQSFTKYLDNPSKVNKLNKTQKIITQTTYKLLAKYYQKELERKHLWN